MWKVNYASMCCENIPGVHKVSHEIFAHLVSIGIFVIYHPIVMQSA